MDVREGLVNMPLRIVVIITCCLSVVGSLTIICSYVFYKSLRTNIRLILVHLSFMDLGAAAANLVGLAVDFDKYYYKQYDNGDLIPIDYPPKEIVRAACVTQAAFAVYFTAGSFMWTLTMAILLYFKIVHKQDEKTAKRTLYTSTAICYLLPVILVAWKCSLHRLGYAPSDSEGWCGDKMYDRLTGERHILMDFISYNMWVFLVYTLVPILYVAILLHIRQLVVDRLFAKVTAVLLACKVFCLVNQKLDVKLLLIPVAFILLRIWSTVSSIMSLYMQIDLTSNANYALLFLAGIGDSGQGFVNAILFVVLTKRVRDQLFCKLCKRSSPSAIAVDSTGERKALLESSYH